MVKGYSKKGQNYYRIVARLKRLKPFTAKGFNIHLLKCSANKGFKGI